VPRDLVIRHLDPITLAVEGTSTNFLPEVIVRSVAGPRGATGHQVQFGSFGVVVTKVGTVGFYPRVAGRIVRVTAAVTTQTAGSTRVDINVNGVTVFTDQTHRPNLAGTGRHFDDADSIDAPTFGATDYITCDIDAVGTGVTDLIVTVDYV
jgi:hypothetical protein